MPEGNAESKNHSFHLVEGLIVVEKKKRPEKRIGRQTKKSNHQTLIVVKRN